MYVLGFICVINYSAYLMYILLNLCTDYVRNHENYIYYRVE